MIPEYERYTAVINDNLLKAPGDLTFKSEKAYRHVLEHVSPQDGQEYLKCIQGEFPMLYADNQCRIQMLCAVNDQYGRPRTTLYPGFMECSPTSLRYLFQALLILKYVQECKLESIDIVEIGGGYGGLCLFLHCMADLFDVDIRSYTIFDLEVATKLQRKYMDIMGIEINATTLDQYYRLQPNSFLVSNYAFSELPEDVRDKYTQQVLNPYVSHGFLAWNFRIVYDFIADKDISSVRERPYTGNPVKNASCYVYVKPKK